MEKPVEQSARGWVHIFMEIKARELDSRLLLACFAAERGHNVLIGPHKFFLRMFNRLPPGVIYDRSIFPIRMAEFHQYHDRYHSIVVNDEESQSIYTNAKFRYFDSRLSDETLDLCERYFAWGDEQRNILANAFPKHADKFTVTGTPRIDVWRAPFNGLYDEQMRNIRERHGPYILVPSNFGLLMNRQSRQELLDQAKKIGTLDTEEGRAFWGGIFDHLQEVLDKYREAIIAMTKRFPDHKVIIRPHPVENIEKWKQFLDGVDGCDILLEGAASPWLKGADAIVHHGCTTSLEAFFMGKNTIAYTPAYHEKYDETLLKKTSLNVSSLNELLDSIEACLKGNLNTNEYVDEDFANYIHWEKESYACEEIVDHITQVITQNDVLVRAGKWRFVMLNSFRNFRAKLKNKRIPLGEKKWPGGLQLQEICDRVDYYCKSSDRLSSLEVEQVLPEGVFWIRKRASR